MRPGDVVTVRCDVVMANDVSGPVAFRAMEKMGATAVFDPSRVVMVADHFVPAKDAKSAELQARLKDWSRAHGVAFYGQGRGGIEHTLLCEEGWIVPGAVVAGGDSHTCTYGALGAFGTGLGSTDIASCLALGRFWQRVPQTIVVELTGSLGPFVAPPTPISPITARIRSFPVTNGCFSPVNSTRIVDGTACQNSPSARQAAMSVDPRPVPKAPSAPYVQVCESPPAITVPG